MNYNSSTTQKYKSGYIITNYIGDNLVVRVMVDQFAYTIQVKSIRSAKIMITKHINRVLNA